jgi:hypothetical protein
MSNFQLNFNTEKKVVRITLDKEDGVLDLAYLFKKILDDAGIPNKISEEDIYLTFPSELESMQVANEKLD